jgi:hypothetical protein
MNTTSTLGEVTCITVRGVTVRIYGTMTGFSVGASMGSTIAMEHGLDINEIGDAATRCEAVVRFASL